MFMSNEPILLCYATAAICSEFSSLLFCEISISITVFFSLKFGTCFTVLIFRTWHFDFVVMAVFSSVEGFKCDFM